MLEDLKTYCMAFIHLIQGNSARKSREFNMDLTEVIYTEGGVHAIYKDLHSDQVYDIVITSRPARRSDETRFLPETL